MRRWSVISLCTLSLLLSAATFVLWMRSYRHGDVFTLVRRGRDDRQITDYRAYSGKGLIYLSITKFTFRLPAEAGSFAPHPGMSAFSIDPTRVVLDDRGAFIARARIERTTGTRYVIIPDWWIASALLLHLLILLFRISLRRARTQTRLKAGCCVACGYDLTGNVSGACPECGAISKRRA